jgi:hypothetical protein
VEKVVSDAGWQALLCRAWPPGHPKRWYLRALREEFNARLYPHNCRTQRRSLKPQLAAAHLPDTSSQTVPLARTMAEKVTAQREWANGRARNASVARST